MTILERYFCIYWPISLWIFWRVTYDSWEISGSLPTSNFINYSITFDMYFKYFKSIYYFNKAKMSRFIVLMSHNVCYSNILLTKKVLQFIFWKYIIKGNLSGYFGFNNEQLNVFSYWPSYYKKLKTIFSIIGCILNYMTKQLCGLMVVITPKTIHIVKHSIIVTILKYYVHIERNITFNAISNDQYLSYTF